MVTNEVTVYLVFGFAMPRSRLSTLMIDTSREDQAEVEAVLGRLGWPESTSEKQGMFPVGCKLFWGSSTEGTVPLIDDHPVAPHISNLFDDADELKTMWFTHFDKIYAQFQGRTKLERLIRVVLAEVRSHAEYLRWCYWSVVCPD